MTFSWCITWPICHGAWSWWQPRATFTVWISGYQGNACPHSNFQDVDITVSHIPWQLARFFHKWHYRTVSCTIRLFSAWLSLCFSFSSNQSIEQSDTDTTPRPPQHILPPCPTANIDLEFSQMNQAMQVGSIITNSLDKDSRSSHTNLIREQSMGRTSNISIINMGIQQTEVKIDPPATWLMDVRFEFGHVPLMEYTHWELISDVVWVGSFIHFTCVSFHPRSTCPLSEKTLIDDGWVIHQKTNCIPLIIPMRKILGQLQWVQWLHCLTSNQDILRLPKIILFWTLSNTYKYQSVPILAGQWMFTSFSSQCLLFPLDNSSTSGEQPLSKEIYRDKISL